MKRQKTATEYPVYDRGRVLDPLNPGVAARYKLNDIFCSSWLSHAISAVVVLGVPDALTDEEPKHFSSLAEQTNTHAPTLYRVLRALAANGIFRENEEGWFQHTDISRLLRGSDPYSWSGMARMWNHPSCLSAWTEHSNSLRDGRSGIEHAFGKPLYEHLHDNPSATRAFAEAMVSNSAHAASSIAREFPFQNYCSVVDLGGGVGTLILAILEAHPHLNGVIFEIPDLESQTRENIAHHNLTSRCDVARGDFFEHIPDGADLYLVKNSLWNWSDELCLKIMKNVREALGRQCVEGRFVIVEYMIDSDNAPWTTLYDLQILNMPGGRARTLSEYKTLLGEAGFVVEEVMHVEDQTLIVAKPA
jgi:O-methyltransferase.